MTFEAYKRCKVKQNKKNIISYKENHKVLHQQNPRKSRKSRKSLNVLLVDDSIVRGTTSKQIIKLAREAGARKVYFASAAPPVRFPNVYGIDMPAANELVAFNRNESEIAEIIGADWLIYQELDDLIDAVQKGNRQIKQFDCSCFDGKYVTRSVGDEYLSKISTLRSDSAKDKGDEELNVVGMELHNKA